MTNRRIALGALAGLLVAATCGAAARGQNIPEGAKYTLLVLRYDEADHIRLSKLALETARKKTGLKDFFLVHTESESVLYFGGYKAVDAREDSEEAARFKGDMAKLAAIEIDGVHPFGAAIGASLPIPDPPAPAEWNIRNSDGAWSLEIAAYRNHPERKQAAVDMVKELRKRGVPAYYFHGETTSSVLLGSFPADAIQITDGNARAEPGKEIVVIPFKPAGMADEVTQPDGSTSKVIAPTIKVSDLTLIGILKHPEYREHAVNGDVMMKRITDPKTGKVTEQRDESFLVDITKIKNDSLLTNPGRREPGASPDVLVPKTQTPGSGLKKVGG